MKKVLLSSSEDEPSTPTPASGEAGPKNSGLASTGENVSSDQPPKHQSQPKRFQPRPLLPVEFMEILTPSLTVGAVTGGLGLFTGAVVSIARYSPHPVAWSISTSIQWFILGSSYYGTRLVTLKAWGKREDDLTPSEKIKASSIAGAVAGATGGAIVGPRSMLPGLFLWSLLGAGGQKVLNEVRSRYSASETKGTGSWLDSKWSPMHKMTDQEYHSYLQEKILSVEAEIAIIDDHIRDLRASAQAKTTSGSKDK